MIDLIEFLDKCAALQRMPREDRIRAGIEQLRTIYPDLPALLGVTAHAALAHPCDDGKPWGRIDPNTGEWRALDKAAILASNVGPPPMLWSAPDGRLIAVVHESVSDPDCEACQ